jgi:hypothetical protein
MAIFMWNCKEAGKQFSPPLLYRVMCHGGIHGRPFNSFQTKAASFYIWNK